MLRPTLLALLLTLPLLAQGARGTVVKPTRFVPNFATEDATNLIVKFVEGSGIRLRDGAWRSDAGLPTEGVRGLVANAVTVTRLFERDEATLDRERTELIAKLAAEGRDIDPPADLNLYYRVRFATVEEGVVAWQALVAAPIVETAFPDTPFGYEADPMDIPPTTPDFSAGQDYFEPGPAGIDMAQARKIPGARGEPLQILDIETGLIVDHEDVPLAIAANVIGANPDPRDHGLAVAGELVADKNGYGVTGGVFKARYKFHSHQSQNWASSVNVAAANSQPGDIIVLEVQLSCPFTGSSVCPMEGRQDVFDACRNATLAGIHVIAAAGNGNNNLDSPAYNGVFDRNVRDSGAILVGATESGQLARASFSNYGSIVDANGWGRNVTTTGYGLLFYPNLDDRQAYTDSFSGTSSATPIVTSAAAATLGAAAFQLGQALTPAELRTLIQNHGTSVASIGVRPDVGQLLAALGLPNGLELQSEVELGDTLVLDVTAAPSEFAIVLFDWQGVASQQSFGRLLLPAATLLLVDVMVGSGTFSTPIPNDITLQGSEVHWQVARVDAATGAISLTNSVVSHFEK